MGGLPLYSFLRHPAKPFWCSCSLHVFIELARRGLAFTAAVGILPTGLVGTVSYELYGVLPDKQPRTCRAKLCKKRAKRNIFCFLWSALARFFQHTDIHCGGCSAAQGLHSSASRQLAQ